MNTNTSLIYSISKGLYEIPELEEVKWTENESFEQWLKRLGFSHPRVQTSITEFVVKYSVYSRQSKSYPYMIELCDCEEIEFIFCQTKADVIGLRAFLAPIVIAENGVSIDVDNTLESVITSTRDNRILLNAKSRFAQVLADTIQFCK